MLVFQKSVGLDKFWMMNKAVLLVGSNIGDLSKNLEQALLLISKESGTIGKASLVYLTEPWGRNDQPHFYNQVVELCTSLSAQVLMLKLLEIEMKMGRERTEKWTPRVIDLDILYFNNEIIDEPGLKIPHPRLHERRFTMEPLSELFPEMIHPCLKLTNKDLLAGLTDTLKVVALNPEPIVKS